MAFPVPLPLQNTQGYRESNHVRSTESMARMGLLPKTNSSIVSQLWRDETGVIHTTDYLVFVSVVCLGSIVGLTEVRTSLVQMMGDIAGSLENLDQSYSFSAGGTTSTFTDTATSADTAGVEPQCISVQIASNSEG